MRPGFPLRGVSGFGGVPRNHNLDGTLLDSLNFLLTVRPPQISRRGCAGYLLVALRDAAWVRGCDAEVANAATTQAHAAALGGLVKEVPEDRPQRPRQHKRCPEEDAIYRATMVKQQDTASAAAITTVDQATEPGHIGVQSPSAVPRSARR